MTLWIAVVAACLLAWLVKLAGYLVPERVLQIPWVDRVVPLLTVALLSALVITQGFLDGARLPALDARAAGVGVALVLLVLRAPFLVVVAAAAATAALLRLWGG
ncbi:AzlD domain-containing protein [Ornithinimicrobium pratense]|uniref:AzlD domain-containing protein n=1 Tax=Ornithinimicrobium pratense TaxID=2593973 RepID=A0A5J6V2S5_9MICO|nr:AzlD domain-containing protein [Ornithinimicrobium pratense]QFG67977.1 AzlD domain-containing protein [Ornithinimicrobium pratense]